MTSPEASKTFIISRQISYNQAPVDSELLHGWSKYSVRVTCTPPLTTTCCMDADLCRESYPLLRVPRQSIMPMA